MGRVAAVILLVRPVVVRRARCVGARTEGAAGPSPLTACREKGMPAGCVTSCLSPFVLELAPHADLDVSAKRV